MSDGDCHCVCFTDRNSAYTTCTQPGQRLPSNASLSKLSGMPSVALRVPAHAPWLAGRSLVHRVTRMTCHAPVQTGGAVGAEWDLD